MISLRAVVLLGVFACSSPPDSVRVSSAIGHCSPSNVESDRVPFVRVNLGPSVHDGIGFVRGPRARVVVRTHDEWAQLWKVIAETTPRPNVELGDSVLVVVASEEFGSGPARVEIEDVRRCRRDGTVLALLRLHTQDLLNDYGDRSIRAVLLGRSQLGDGTIAFVDLPAAVRH